MKTEESKVIKQRKHLNKLLESLTEKDLYVIKSFVEYLKQAKTKGDDVFLNKLLSSDFDKAEVNEKTLLEVKKAKAEVRKKKYSSLDKVMKEFEV